MLPAEVLDAAEASGKAVVVGNDDAGIQTLEVQNDDGVGVETRLGLHDQSNILRSSHMSPLLDTRRQRHNILRLRNPTTKPLKDKVLGFLKASECD